MRFSLKPLTARLRALSQESQDFYWDNRYSNNKNDEPLARTLDSCIARLRSISSEKVDFSVKQSNYGSNTTFSLDPYINQIRSTLPKEVVFAERKFIWENRSPKNNTQKKRGDILIKKDRCFTQPAENGLESWTLKKGSKITRVQSFARGWGIDRVQEKIDNLKKKGTTSHVGDWEKMKGSIVAYRDGQAYLVEIHFYFCKNIGYFDFKVKHIYRKLG